MTDEKCLPAQMRAEEFIRDRQRNGGLVTITAELLREFVRDSFEEGHEEGYRCATEFVASGEECPHRA